MVVYPSFPPPCSTAAGYFKRLLLNNVHSTRYTKKVKLYMRMV